MDWTVGEVEQVPDCWAKTTQRQASSFSNFVSVGRGARCPTQLTDRTPSALCAAA